MVPQQFTVLEHACRRLSGQWIQWIFYIVDFIYDFNQLFSGIIPRIGFCHHWALFVIEICFGEAITRKDILEEERKFIFNGYRFADDLIRYVHNEDASLSLRSHSDSSSLSSKCMPTWMTFSSIIILVPQFQEYSRRRTFTNTLTKLSRLLWLPIFITRTARRPAVLIDGRDDNDCFLYMLLQLFAMHKPRLQAPSDYISDVFDSLDPWPQQYSCSFRFKWLALIVPWGSSVTYRPGNLLSLLLLASISSFLR